MKASNVIPINGDIESQDVSERHLFFNYSPEADQLLDEMTNGYEQYKRGTKKNTPKSVDDEISLIKRFATDTGRYPWEWTFLDWDNWNSLLVEVGKVASSTQRKYQGAISSFTKYLHRTIAFQQKAQALFGQGVDLILDGDDALLHIYEREAAKPRAVFTPKFKNQLFNSMKAIIRQESACPTRVLSNLQRDFTFLYIVSATGLRAGSALALNIHSFEPNPAVPEMGEYGVITTTGKGARGSGPKLLSVPVDDVQVPELLDWYINHVRPNYLKSDNPNEQALFLSERGTRMSYATAAERLQKHLSEAGLGNLGLTLHSFRRGKATESLITHGLETTRRMLGHEFGTTTQGYAAVPDEYCQTKINDHLRTELALREKRQKEG